MKYNKLGKTSLNVSEVCFGTLTVGPLQRNLPVREGADLMIEAYDRGINFFDTSDLYQTYPYLKRLLQARPESVICTKSYDYTKEGVEKRLNKALRETGRDYVDLYMLHEQESRYTFEGHYEAIEALLKARKEGKIRAFGISTHRVEAVRDARDFKEIEVVFPLMSPTGIGIEDGSIDEMVEAVKRLREEGRGVYAMKPLGGGTLIKERRSCFSFARKLLENGTVDSVAVGIQNRNELEYDIRALTGAEVPAGLEERIDAQPRKLHIDDWCERCGACVERCGQNALHMGEKTVEVDRERCLACGYCASVCPVFCLKII